jgi:3-oxoacyl-[acyl-carrier-protein] synthase III
VGVPPRAEHGAVGLSRVSVRFPRGTEPVDRVLERAGHDVFERRIARYYGLRDTPTLAPDERMEDLLAQAGREALAGRGADVVLYAHSLDVQEFAIRPGFGGRLCAALGAAGAGFYGVSQINCASLLRAVKVARRYHDRPGAGPGDRVLVLGGDQGSYDDSARIIPRVTVAGDAAAAVIVHSPRSPESPRYRYLSGGALRDDRFHRNLRMTEKEQALYTKACLGHVATVLHEAAARAGLRVTDLDWIMPNLTNALFWRNFCRAAGVDRDRVCLDLLPLRGHNYGIDALLALQHADLAGRLRHGDRCALIAIGVGAYVEVVILQVTGE